MTRYLFIFSLTLLLQTLFQTEDKTSYTQEKVKILNVVLNSAAFDSAYPYKKVCFMANELLSQKTPIVLRKGLYCHFLHS